MINEFRYNERFGSSLNAVSYVIQKSVRYFCSAKQLKNTNEEDSNKFICFVITEDSVILLSTNFKCIICEILVENIQSVEIDKNYISIFQITLKKTVNAISKRVCFSVSGCLQPLIKELKLVYVSYIMLSSKNYFSNETLELTVEENEGVLDYYNIATSTFVENEFNIIEKAEANLPKNYEILILEDKYIAYFPIEATRTKNIFWIGNQDKKPFQIGFTIFNALPLEYFIAYPEDEGLEYYAHSLFFKKMKDKHLVEHFSIFCSSPYLKKQGLVKDVSTWEGWKIEARIKDKHNNVFNIKYVFYRRSFLPPLCDSFQDICLYVIEDCTIDEYNQFTSFEMTEETSNCFELACNSITPINEDRGCLKLLSTITDLKMNTFSANNKSLGYFTYSLGLFGRTSIKLALDFSGKMIALIDETTNFLIKNTSDFFFEQVSSFYKVYLGESDFKLTDYLKKLKEKDFTTLLSEFYGQVKRYLTLDTKNMTKEASQVLAIKRNEFLFWCLDGGVSNYTISMEEILRYFIMFPSLHKYNYVLNLILSPIHNVGLESSNEPNLNEVYSLKDFQYHLYDDTVSHIDTKYLSLLIKTGYLKSLFNLNESNFLIVLKGTIIKFPNILILRALHEYLLSANKTLNPHEKARYIDLLIPVYNLFRDHDNCPLFIEKCCDILIFLSNQGQLIQNMLINTEIFDNLVLYTESNHEPLVFKCLVLWSILFESFYKLRFNLLSLFKQFVDRLKLILEGTQLPNTFHSDTIIIFSLEMIIQLCKKENSIIKEETSQDTTFIKSILTNLSESNVHSPYTFETSLKTKIRVLELLEILVRNNSSLRQYLFSKKKVHCLINTQCRGLIQSLKKFIGKKELTKMEEEKSLLYFAYTCCLIRFVVSFLSKDITIAGTIESHCPHLVDLILFILENHSYEHFNTVASLCLELYTMFYSNQSEKESKGDYIKLINC